MAVKHTSKCLEPKRRPKSTRDYYSNNMHRVVKFLIVLLVVNINDTTICRDPIDCSEFPREILTLVAVSISFKSQFLMKLKKQGASWYEKISKLEAEKSVSLN